ncbi:MAG TPA: V-type ATPase 116kDa subunit family protein, partial [Deinococcales bacterium]|nr:V-type ATPase 116kDa subunit family protein [Deinococcales bacterium]
MIADMAQVLIVGRKRDSLEVVRALQDVGVVQIDPLDSAELERSALAGADAERRAVLERQLARVESILAALGNPQVAPAPTRLKSISDLGSYLEEVGHRADVLVRERAELESELATTGTYRQVARAAAELAGNLDRSERVAVLAFTADAEDLTALRAALDANLGAPYEIGTRQAGAVTTGVLAVRRRDEAAARALLGRAGVSELRLGGRFANLPYSSAALLIEERSRTGPEELLGVREGLENIAREHAPTLVAARYELRDEIGRYAAIEAGARGRYGFALRGWLPVANKPALESALAPLKNQVLYQFEAPDLHHAEHVPVKLENNAFVKPFELLMGIFAPPGYGTYDPTWVIALFFPIFFGFVIGDIGLGLLFLLLALVLRGRANAGKDLNLGMLGVVVPPKPLRSVATIVTWMSLWSIVFGFVYG